MEYEQLTRSAHGVAQNTFHLVWVTKYRKPIFTDDWLATTARNAILVAAKRHKIHVFEIEVMEEHIHIFVRLPRSMSIEHAFRVLKGYSSYQIRRVLPEWKRYKAVWSKFSFSRTVGSVTGGVIEHYIKESNTRGRYGNQRSLKEFGEQ